jgi:hypothetical protein
MVVLFDLLCIAFGGRSLGIFEQFDTPNLWGAASAMGASIVVRLRPDTLRAKTRTDRVRCCRNCYPTRWDQRGSKRTKNSATLRNANKSVRFEVSGTNRTGAKRILKLVAGLIE